MSQRRRAIMLGFDAAGFETIEQLVGEGRLPNLGRLMHDGCFGKLSARADLYAGGVWPCFYTGQATPWHGVFHNKLWRPDAMRAEVPSDDWISARPFWESLSDANLNLCIVDVPMVVDRPKPIRGMYLAGWGTHDLIHPGSSPSSLWPELERRFGSPIMPKEHFGKQTSKSLERLRATLLASTDQMCEIAIDLLDRDSWDFACIVFGAIHRAGHYLWDHSQIDEQYTERGNADVLAPSLTDVYESADAALGRVLEHVSRDTLVIVFAAHGMGPNPGWSDLLPNILAELERHRSGKSPTRGLLYQLKQLLPFHWIRPILTRLPTSVTDRLVPLWSQTMFDWNETPYFPVPMDHAGYLRINLRGRETQGIVTTSEYASLCSELERLLRSLRDEASGEPLVADIVRAYEEADADAPARALIPDLIVCWNGRPARSVRRVVSSELPDFAYDVPRFLPSGRSGNHTDDGWFAARGPDVATKVLVARHSVLDLAPTILEYFGVDRGSRIQGSPIDLRSSQ